MAALGWAELPDPDGRACSSAARELVRGRGLEALVWAARRDGPRAALGRRLAELWGVPAERVRAMLDLHKPAVAREGSALRAGRVVLPLVDSGRAAAVGGGGGGYALTRHGVALLERVAAAVRMREPLLLVGETGTGKTTAVQQLAAWVGAPLAVHNLNQQTDSTDLLGGYRPTQLRALLAPLAARFEDLFCRTFSRQKNAAFLEKLAQRLAKAEWKKLLSLMRGAARTLDKRAEPTADAEPSPTKKPRGGSGGGGGDGGAVDGRLHDEWRVVMAEVRAAERQLERPDEAGLAFAFEEGALVRALREGQWLLLDEVNLASSETLQRVAGLLDGADGSVALTEKGEASSVKRHPNFRIFAAMNPPTDFGKKELPAAIRARFTELYVPPIELDEDLQLVVLQYLQPLVAHPPVSQIVAFYRAALGEASARCSTARTSGRSTRCARCAARSATRRAPRRLRAATRALRWVPCDLRHSARRRPPASRGGAAAVDALGRTEGGARGDGAAAAPGGPWTKFGAFWLAVDGRGTPEDDARYIVTPTVAARLQQLARMVAARRHPVLLQGPSSAGKTSMVERLAKATGHRLIRINNHEHTDVSEYIGTFTPDADGRLVFVDGALTQAVRHGYWIVLDELNLAPSEVLEALNRLLDDNRELHVPETGEVVRPHEHFMLFATQNPPGSFGGRKVLSRAFRNRFLEAQLDELPTSELQTILERRCKIAPPFAAKMVGTMVELQRRRASSRVFQGKHGFITPRDLFRWGDRQPADHDELAAAGYALLAERLRQGDETAVVLQVLRQLIPHGTLDPAAAYAAAVVPTAGPSTPVWIASMRRLYSLVSNCCQYDEPVLLVGETGTGKTTVCELYAQAVGQTLHMINCHQHTETADFIGGLRPVRGRAMQLARLLRRVEAF